MPFDQPHQGFSHAAAHGLIAVRKDVRSGDVEQAIKGLHGAIEALSAFAIEHTVSDRHHQSGSKFLASVAVARGRIRQFTAWGNTDPGRHVLIAVARYLAAHSPTERAALQTADIAQRLMRGGELHEEGEAS
jgi:hypothetical protein